MNILKEQIKLSVAYPGWRSAIKKLKSNKNKKIFLVGTPMHGNLGDHAIAIQEQYFFEDFFPDYEYFEILMPMYHTQKKIIKNAVTPEDLVVISACSTSLHSSFTNVWSSKKPHLPNSCAELPK